MWQIPFLKVPRWFVVTFTVGEMWKSNLKQTNLYLIWLEIPVCIIKTGSFQRNLMNKNYLQIWFQWQIPFLSTKRKKDVVLEFVLYSGIHQSFWADLVKGNVSYCDHLIRRPSVNFSHFNLLQLKLDQSASRTACGGHVCYELSRNEQSL
jgi:hypothetical protein